MTAGPVARAARADLHGHADAVAGVIGRAAHFREIPVGPQIARAHFGARLKAARREDNGFRRNLVDFAFSPDFHAGNRRTIRDQLQRAGLIPDIDAAFRRRADERVDQPRTAAPGLHRQPAPELEFPVDLERLPPVDRHEAHALFAHPADGGKALPDQHFAEVRIGAVLGHAEHVIEKLVFGVGAEIRRLDLRLGQVRHHRLKILQPVIGKTDRARGKAGVTAAHILRRAFEDENLGAVLLGA